MTTPAKDLQYPPPPEQKEKTVNPKQIQTSNEYNVVFWKDDNTRRKLSHFIKKELKPPKLNKKKKLQN